MDTTLNYAEILDVPKPRAFPRTSVLSLPRSNAICPPTIVPCAHPVKSQLSHT
jgi:hypothetical protein